MKRFHVHVGVADLDQSIAFYSGLFGQEPTLAKPDYAKWMLEDPQVNFAISSREGAPTGVQHLGVQAEAAPELKDIYDRLKAADRPVLEEGMTNCCYSRSEKSWISDPDGVVWEAFMTVGDATVYGGDADPTPQAEADGPCCTAETPQGVCCPPKPDKPADAPCCG